MVPAGRSSRRSHTRSNRSHPDFNNAEGLGMGLGSHTAGVAWLVLLVTSTGRVGATMSRLNPRHAAT